ncbi:MAG: hypothetical protein LN568_00445 [Rickettsia endosymbiont of Pseudomimeciton antennatum]|nr:hypothetical protein [Rickettsia endosymbiont of Pseudomimeciton antennatum]
MSKRNKKANSLNKTIQNIDKEFEKAYDDLDKGLSKVEEVADIFNDSLDRIVGSVSEQEVNKLLEEMQSEVNLEQKNAELEKQKDQELYARLDALRDSRPTKEALKNPAPMLTDEELYARLERLKEPIPTEEALKNPAPTPTVEKPQQKVYRSQDNQTKQPQSIKPTTTLVNKVAARPKDTKLETNSPATSPEPLVKEPSKPDKSDRDTLPLSTTKAKQTGWFAKIVNTVINVIVDNIKGLFGNSQIQDAPPKQQSKQVILEKLQADVKKLREPLAALKEVQEARKQALKVKRMQRILQKAGPDLQKARQRKALSGTPTRLPTKSPVTMKKPGNIR